MLFTTPTQFAVLGLVLIAGWLLGLASHSGGAKWKERYAAEREAHAATRRDGDARVADVERRLVERERVVTTPVVARNPEVTRPVTTTAAQPAHPVAERRGWFDWKQPTVR